MAGLITGLAESEPESCLPVKPRRGKAAKLDKRYLTLFVLSNSAGKTRQLRVSVRLLKAAVAVGVVFAVVFLACIYDYVRIKGNYPDYSSLQKENTEQKMELQSFASKISDLETKMARLSLFDKKLRMLASMGASKDSSTAHNEQVMGIGGPSLEDERFDPGSGLDELVKRMRSDIESLERGAADQETSFTELQEHLVKQASFLAATPSIWPTRGWVTSTYGDRVSPFTGKPHMHKGLDIANSMGTPVIATANGIVVRAGRNGGLGKSIVISHGYGVKTTYGHLSQTFVRVGQKVKRGDKIASLGNTGRSTGPHLHYEVSFNGMSVNPSRYILN